MLYYRLGHPKPISFFFNQYHPKTFKEKQQPRKNSVLWISPLTALRETWEVWKAPLNSEDEQNSTLTSGSDLHLFEVDGSLQHIKVNTPAASQCFSETENGA